MVLNWTYTGRTNRIFLVAERSSDGTCPRCAIFDLITSDGWLTAPPSNSTWVGYVRKGEGKVGVFYTSQAEAWQKLFLSGVVEHSLMAGFDTPFDSSGWTGKIGPWAGLPGKRRPRFRRDPCGLGSESRSRLV